MLDSGPEVLRDVAMATNLGTQFAITGFVGYNVGCMIASDTLFDSRGGFSGSIKPSYEDIAEIQCLEVAMTTVFGFLYMGCTLHVRVRRRCGLMSNYFDQLLWDWVER